MKQRELNKIEKQIRTMEQDYNQRLGAARILKEQKKKLQDEIAALTDEIEEEKIIGIFLKKVSAYSRGIVKSFIEDTVTDALQFIFYPGMRFEIELNDDPDKEKSKPYAEAFIVEDIGGQEIRQLPQNACGGGAIDVVSAALRIAFVELSHKPVLRGPCLFDEPGKHLSREEDLDDPTKENYSLRFASYLKSASDMFGRQYIMVSHNPNLINVADHSIRVTKPAGKSEIEYI